MKRVILLVSIFYFALGTIQSAPKWLKNAAKSIVRIYAIQQTGDTLQANGFFLDETGNVVTSFKTLQNAQSAWITDAAGKRFEVSRIKGFNSTYDAIVLKAETGKKKTVSLPISKTTTGKGTVIYLMPQGEADEVTQVEKANDYNYYTLKSKANAELVGLPAISETGEVVAIIQNPIVIAQAPNYALDINFAKSLFIRPIDANHADLKNCSIRKQLPQEESQAVSFLYMTGAMENNLRMGYIEDFISAFPHNATGYTQKAELQSAQHEYDAAFQTYEEGLKQETGHNDEILCSRSRTIYSALLQDKSLDNPSWTLEQAMKDIKAAEEINPLPLYTLHQAHVLFGTKQYDEAYQKYMATTQTSMRSPEAFIYAWQCKQNLKATNEELLALNDSAVACFSKPYSKEAAPYLLLRSNTLNDMGKIREAVADLNDYEHLMQGMLNAQFYYQREQMEIKVRMFGPALNDIQKAISLLPEEPLYHAESASLFYRLNEVDHAILECKKAIELDEKFPDAYRLLGICLRDKGDNAGAKIQLQKAFELGDTLAKEILDKLP